MRVAATLLALASLLAPVTARSSTGDRVLVVRDKKYDHGYNKFFESLKGAFRMGGASGREESAMDGERAEGERAEGRG